MDAKTYVKNVLVTESRDLINVKERLSLNRNIRLIHASAGITSEITEIIDLYEKSYSKYPVIVDRVNLMEECSDLLWYIGIACDELDCTDKVTMPEGPFLGKSVNYDTDLADFIFTSAMRMSKFGGEFVDIVFKKNVMYGKPFNAEPLVDLLTKIHIQVEFLLECAGYTVEEARERNIAKLKARYGEKFSEAAALERNLENERQILENK